jgi:hypothetical protein
LGLGIVGTKEYRKPEWVSHMEDMQEKLKGKIYETMSDDSLEHGCVTERLCEWDSPEVSSGDEEEGGGDKEGGSFYLLPPIEEKSEPSSSESGKTIECEKRCVSLHNLTLRHQEDDDSDSTRCQTFPRAKTTEAAWTKNQAGPKHKFGFNNTLYPLEPRELDPDSFQQLHTADSCEELQEFLLLESQCMTADQHGLAAAFLTPGALQ